MAAPLGSTTIPTMALVVSPCARRLTRKQNKATKQPMTISKGALHPQALDIRHA